MYNQMLKFVIHKFDHKIKVLKTWSSAEEFRREFFD